MKQLSLVFAVCAVLGLSACSEQAAETTASTQAAVTVPAGSDKAEWNKYMNAVIKPHFIKGETMRVWPYLVIPSETEENARKLDALRQSVVNGLQAGQLFVYLGPDSTATADLILEGFKEAKPDSLTRSTLLFVGKRADEERVKTVVAASGMSFKFHPVD
jgi:hypothetical protein